MYEKTIRIPQVATDYNLNLSMNYLFDMVLEMGNLQSEAVGMPYDELLRRGVTWMLYRIKVKINRLPKAKEKVVMRTWVSTLHRLRTKREVSFYTEDGETLIDTTTEWLVVDIKKNRAIRIPEFIKEHFTVEGFENFDSFPKLKRKPIEKEGKDLTIVKSDIDYNKHVNSGVYFRWVTDSIEKDNSQLKEIDLYYKAQVFYKSHGEMRIEKLEDGYLHQILSDGEVAVVGKTIWE